MTFKIKIISLGRKIKMNNLSLGKVYSRLEHRMKGHIWININKDNLIVEFHDKVFIHLNKFNRHPWSKRIKRIKSKKDFHIDM